MKTLSIIALCFIIISCNYEKENGIFVIEEYNKKYLQDSVKYAPYDYYGPNNVIIMESTNEIFYHNNRTSCGTGWNVKDPPRKLDFQKNPLLKFTNIKELMEKISQSEKKTELIMIASNTDTIRNKAYFDLKDMIQQTPNTQIIATRKATNDEINAIENNYVTQSIE